MKRGCVVFGLFALAALAVIFMLVDFRLARSETRVEGQAETYSISLQPGEKMPLNQDLNLKVEAPRGMETMVTRGMIYHLERSEYIWAARLLFRESQADAGPLLIVKVDPQGMLIWTPVFAFSNLQFEASYASDGETAWMEGGPVEMQSGDPTVRLHGSFTLRDRSFGLMSYPGYASYIVDKMANKVRETVEKSMVN